MAGDHEADREEGNLPNLVEDRTQGVGQDALKGDATFSDSTHEGKYLYPDLERAGKYRFLC